MRLPPPSFILKYCVRPAKFDTRLRWREMFPIVARELRVAAKRRVTYRLRTIVALSGSVVVIAAAIVAGDYSVEVGQFVFWSASAVMLLICGAAGLLLTADSISREKREGTLGLLFLTRLTSADVVLGKLTVGALSGGAVAFAGLPFLAFSLCLGGVTAREFWLMSGALFFLLAYSLTLGIFVSTLFRKESVVALMFLLLMAGPIVATPFAIMKWHAIPPLLAKINAFFPALTLIDSADLYFNTKLAATVLAFQLLAIVVMLLASFLVLPWTVRSERAIRSQIRISSRRFLRRRVIPAGNPVYFLSRRHGQAAALFLLCAGLYFVVGFAASTPWEAEVTFVLLMAFLPKLFVLWHSSGAMALERQSGFLETLLTTPLSGAEVLRGKISAIKWQIAPALLFALIALWATSTKWWGSQGEITVGATLVFSAMITLLVDVHAIGWVGLWQGLMARDRRRALIWATLFGVVGPWIPAALAWVFLDLIFDDPRWMTQAENILPPAMISANVVSVAIACFAMARLHEKFRSTATQTWASPRGNVAVPEAR
jgi:ABC-type transport system involved in multi-copper enzyme maturation permease subunit